MSMFEAEKQRVSTEDLAPRGEGLSALVLLAGLVLGISAERKAAALREYSLGGGTGIAIGDMGTGSSLRYRDLAQKELSSLPDPHDILIPDDSVSKTKTPRPSPRNE